MTERPDGKLGPYGQQVQDMLSRLHGQPLERFGPSHGKGQPGRLPLAQCPELSAVLCPMTWEHTGKRSDVPVHIEQHAGRVFKKNIL